MKFRKMLGLCGCVSLFVKMRCFREQYWKDNGLLPADEWMTSPWGGLTQHAGAPLAPFQTDLYPWLLLFVPPQAFRFGFPRWQTNRDPPESTVITYRYNKK